MLKKAASLRQGYGRQASGVLALLPNLRAHRLAALRGVRAHVLGVRSPRQAYSAEVATKAGSTCGLAERAFFNILLDLRSDDEPSLMLAQGFYLRIDFINFFNSMFTFSHSKPSNESI